MATATQNGKTSTTPVDLQAVGEARLAEVVAALNSNATDLNVARHGIVGNIRTISGENLWVYAKDAEGNGYNGWKPLVKDLLGTALHDWSDKTRASFILMLIDEGFTPAEAAEVTGAKPSDAKKAVKQADDEAQGKDVEPAAPAAEPTAEQKADKVATQAIAANAKVADVLMDISAEKRGVLLADYQAIVAKIEGLIETLGDIAAA